MLESFCFPTYTTVEEIPITYCENISPKVFEYPFFNQGIGLLRKPLAERNTTILERQSILSESKLLPIQGFIFHTSHCGSTLLGRMLGSSTQVRMISESESINGLLLSYLLYNLPEAQTLAKLKRILDAYRIPGDGKKSIFFKLTSWNSFLIHLFQKIYPNIPWMYIDRDKEELVQILKNGDGGFIEWWHHPMDILRKHFLENASPLDFKDYLTKVIEGHKKHAHAAKNSYGLFLNYPEFLNEFPKILAHFQLSFSSEELIKSSEFKRFESKKFEPTIFQVSEKYFH